MQELALKAPLFSPNLTEIFNPTKKGFGIEDDYFTRSDNKRFQ